MIIAHLTSSTFFGGPERQMLGLARALPAEHRTVFFSFSEGGRCGAFLERAEAEGFESLALENDTPRFLGAVRELKSQLERVRADVLCCHGYKADLLGRVAARRIGVPAVGVSRGWTGENGKVRIYEALDRLGLRWMDGVICVSEAQAARVRHSGVPEERITVIRNAICPERFDHPDPSDRDLLHRLFARPRGRIVGAAGRLSPEKGYEVLVEAAERVLQDDPDVGFIVFGDGPLRASLAAKIASKGLSGVFILAGFRDDLDRFMPFFDVMVQSSFTEGMPNVVLEACAAGVPVVATDVGGTPEIVEAGVTGVLVRPGDVDSLARGIVAGLTGERRETMAHEGRRRIHDGFSFQAQAGHYHEVLTRMLAASHRGRIAATASALTASRYL